MAATYTENGTNTPNGSHLEFTYTFPVLLSTDVKVALNGVTQATTKYTVSTSPAKITFNNTSVDSTVQESSGAPSTGVIVRVYRETGVGKNTGDEDPKAVFASGSSIRAADLNNNFEQALFGIHELQERPINEEDISDDAVAYAKIQNVTATDRVLGRDSAGAGIVEEIAPAALRTMINVEDGSTADQTNDEIRTAVGAASDSNIFTDTLKSKLDGITAGANAYTISSDLLDEDNFASDSATKPPSQQSTKAYIGTYAQPKDADLTTLAGMQTGTASKLADSTALTADLAEINTICDGKAVHTTISDSDAHYPTSGAVVDYVAAQIAPIGGLEVIADEDNFPAIPASGVVISIADVDGIVINGSGVCTTARTAGNGSDNVTINGFPTALRSKTLSGSLGLMVSSTGSSNTYNYHKLLGKEDDIEQLSQDISDFGNRYRVHAGEPGSNNDEGDLVYDTNADKMKVYDSSTSAWKEVTSTGDFKFLVPVDVGTTTAATWDGSDTSFDLKEATNSGSAASVTNVNQLMVVLNGVVQKPNAGSWSGSGEGFYLTDADTIRFATAPPSGSTAFIVQSGSAVSIPTPGNGTVTAAKIASGAVETAKIADDAVTGGKLNISLVQGDVIYASGTDTLARLAKGTAGQVLKINSGATAPEWGTAAAGASGGGTDKVFWENGKTVTTNYTITNNTNAGTFGPVTINSGITVTVGAGESWTVI